MRNTMPALIPLLLVAACADQPVSPTAQAERPNLQTAQGPIIHKVSVGGPDICSSPQVGLKPGCDANLSLIAIEWADGSVTGQWTDQYGPADGLHAVVDCLKVGVIPGRTTLEAWVGGVVTRPASQAGHRIITRMRDNGTSANERPDAIGRGIVDPEEEGFSSNCRDYPPADGRDMGFGQMIEGQVTIW
jgi:hypothetical protein